MSNYRSKQDLSAFDDFYKTVKSLENKKVSYGFYDNPHYSDLNTATLAAIHTEGWGGLPPRNFMESSSLLFKKDLEKVLNEMFDSIIGGNKSFEGNLKKLGKVAVKNLEQTIKSGKFTNNTVSPAWAEVKGFSEAMIHYGDLVGSASWKIENTKAKRSQ